MVRSLNLDGDGQADLTVHGGTDKAIYVYPFEHYEYWRDELPHIELTPSTTTIWIAYIAPATAQYRLQCCPAHSSDHAPPGSAIL